jgi:hypothetical protein
VRATNNCQNFLCIFGTEPGCIEKEILTVRALVWVLVSGKQCARRFRRAKEFGAGLSIIRGKTRQSKAG